MKSYRKKRLTGLLVFVLLVCIYIIVIRLLKLPDSIRYRVFDSPEEITESDIHTFAEVTFDSLRYTGTDYLQDGAAIGSYYYYEIKNRNSLFASRYLLVLVRTTTGEAELTGYTCRCRILDSSGLPGVLSTLSAGSHIRYGDVEQMFCPMVLSEADYPRTAIIMTYVCMIFTAFAIIAFPITVFRDTKQKGKH